MSQVATPAWMSAPPVDGGGTPAWMSAPPAWQSAPPVDAPAPVDTAVTDRKHELRMAARAPVEPPMGPPRPSPHGAMTEPPPPKRGFGAGVRRGFIETVPPGLLSKSAQQERRAIDYGYAERPPEGAAAVVGSVVGSLPSMLTPTTDPLHNAATLTMAAPAGSVLKAVAPKTAGALRGVGGRLGAAATHALEGGGLNALDAGARQAAEEGSNFIAEPLKATLRTAIAAGKGFAGGTAAGGGIGALGGKGFGRKGKAPEAPQQPVDTPVAAPANPPPVTPVEAPQPAPIDVEPPPPPREPIPRTPKHREAPTEGGRFEADPETYTTGQLMLAGDGPPGIGHQPIDDFSAVVVRNADGKPVGVLRYKGDTITDIAVAKEARGTFIPAQLLKEAKAKGATKAAGPFTPESHALAKRAGLIEGEAPRAQEAPTPEAKAAPEAVLEAKPVTSARRATMDEDRKALGLDELPEPERRGWETVLDEAKQEGPDYGRRLADEVHANPRPFNDKETAGVVIEAARLKTQHKTLVDKMAKATDEADKAFASAEMARVQEEFDHLSSALRMSGTEKGRALAAQKLTIDQDFDLVSVTSRARAAKGKPLTEAESSRLADLTAKLEAVTKRVEEMAAVIKTAAPAAPKVKLSTKATRKLDSIEQAALARIKARQVPRGPNTGATTLGGDLIDYGIVLAARAARAGVKGAEAVRAFVDSQIDGLDPSLRAKLDDVVKATESQLETLAKDPDLTPTQANRLRKQIDDLQQKVDDPNFQPPARKPKPTTQDKEIERLTFERDRLRRLLNQKVEDLRPRGPWEKVAEVGHTSRNLVASADFSATFRQGGFVGAGHPIMAAKATKPMFQAFGLTGEGGRMAEHRAMKEILDRPNAPLYARAKLGITEIGGKLTGQEERFMSHIADKIPLVAGSQRAYTTYLNRLRADYFDYLVDTLGHKGRVTEKEAKALATFVNIATGRGNLGRFEQAGPMLNAFFFAPKLVASRFQLLTAPLGGFKFGSGTMRTRTLIAREYARSLSGIAAFYSLVGLGISSGVFAGASLEFDPRSSDFGKIKVGNTRIDPLMGLAQVTRLVSGVVTGERKTAKGKVVPMRGDRVRYGQGRVSDAAFRFLRTKFNPMVGTAVDLADGQNVVGEKVTAQSAAIGLVTPLSFREIYESMQEHGVAKGTALGILNVFGMGVQTQSPR